MHILTDKKAWQSTFATIKGIKVLYADLTMSTESLYDYCKKAHIDYVLSFNYQTHLTHLRKQSKSLPLIPWLLPNETAAQMEDKFYSHQWLIEEGYTDYLPQEKSPSDFPYILKKKNGTSGQYVFYIENKAALMRLGPLPTQRLRQAYIHSPYEYAYHFLALRGEVKLSHTYEHDFRETFQSGHYYIRGKHLRNTNARKIELRPDFKAVLHSIIQTLNYTGIGCFDIKIHDNRLFLLECNSRMGGSLLFYDHQLHDFKSFLSHCINLMHIYAASA